MLSLGRAGLACSYRAQPSKWSGAHGIDVVD
jgi:hypothetical protein